MRDFKDVVAKLNEFTSPDDIAAHFEEHGIRAIPASADSCAISKYVAKETAVIPTLGDSVATSFSFNPTHAETPAYVRHSRGLESSRVFLSHVAADFIYRFDSREYPNLISEEEERDA